MNLIPLYQKMTARDKDIVRYNVAGILINFILSLFKYFIGVAIHSTAVVIDAINGLADMLFMKYNKAFFDEHPDYDHFLMGNWFTSDYQEQVNSGMLSYYKDKVFTFDKFIIYKTIYIIIIAFNFFVSN